MFTREQVVQFVALTLGAAAVALRQIKWVGSYLAALVTDPAFEAFLVERIVAILERFGSNPPATAALTLSAIENQGFAADAASADVVQRHVTQIEQALRAAGAK